MSGSEENGVVRFTVKELLAQLDGKLDKVIEKIDEKAPQYQVDALDKRVDSVERKWTLATGFLACAQIAFGVYLKFVL